MCPALKYDLKNRPRFATSEMLRLSDAERHMRVEDWFEGFEKELRERYHSKRHPSVAQDALIKEILGE